MGKKGRRYKLKTEFWILYRARRCTVLELKTDVMVIIYMGKEERRYRLKLWILY